MKFLKKGLVLMLLTLTTLSFSGELDKFLFNFTPENMLQSESDEMKYLGHLLINWQSGYEFLDNIEELELNYTEKEQVMINFLKGIEKYVYIAPLNKLEEMKNEYSDSLIFNSIYLYMGSEYWIETGDPKYAEKMFNTAEKIEQLYGKKVPLTIYYDSYIAWYSNLFEDKKRAFENIQYGYFNYGKEKSILELYIIMTNELGVFENLDKTYKDYMSYETKDFNIVLTLASSYKKMGNYEKSKEIAQYVVNNATSTFVLRDSYEMLGDLSQSYEDKIKYYKMASSKEPENWRLLKKLGMAYYEQDPEENAQLARVILNMSITKNPRQPEVEKVLDKLRKNVIIHNITYYVLPIIGVFVLGIFLLLRYEKKKKKEEKDMIYNKSRNDHNEH